MNRIVVTLAAAVAVGVVAVPVALAEGGTPGQREGTSKPAVTCARTSFCGPDHARRDGRRRRAPGLLGDRSPARRQAHGRHRCQAGRRPRRRLALAPGQRARFLVRACRSDDRKVLTALVILLAKKAETAPPGTETTPSEPKRDDPRRRRPPKPSQETCGQGELNTVLVAVSSSSITVRTTSSEGTKDWSVAITGDTVVRKNDQTVPASSLKAGDLVHVVLVRCPSGSVRALKIAVLQASAQA